MRNLAVGRIRHLGWMALLAVVGCGRPTMVADDAVVMGGKPTPLLVHVGRKDLFDLHNSMHDVTVRFEIDGRGIGHDAIDGKGRASVAFDGSAGRPDTFKAHAHAGNQRLEASGRIFYWQPGRVIVAVDMDYCIARTNYLRLLFGKHIPVSPPFEGAREVIASLSNDYQILYFTARPRSMLNRSRQWLDHYGFPPGPVIVSDRFEAVLRQLEWKRDMLKQLQEQYPALLVSIGNRKLDIESALTNDILPLTVQSIENDTKDDHTTVFLQDWKSLGQFFRINRQTLIDPGTLARAIREGARLQQPVRDEVGRYRYVQKCVNCQDGDMREADQAQDVASPAQAHVEDRQRYPDRAW